MADIQLLRMEKETVPLSNAVIHNGIVYVSGQAAVDAEKGAPTSPDLREQTRETLRRIENILEAAGSSKDKILMVRIYLTDAPNDFAAMNEEYSKWLEGHRPARTTVGAALALEGLKVEIDCTAALA